MCRNCDCPPAKHENLDRKNMNEAFNQVCLHYFPFFLQNLFTFYFLITHQVKDKKKVKKSIGKDLKNFDNDVEMLDSTLELEDEESLMMNLVNDDHHRGTYICLHFVICLQFLFCFFVYI